jgi:hypothetical protein
MVKAHGGSRMIQSVEGGGSLVMSGILQNTMANVPKDIHMKGLCRLISNTTGVPKEEPLMEGVISATVPASMKSVPEYHKVPEHDQGKTQAKRMGQVPYSGKKY